MTSEMTARLALCIPARNAAGHLPRLLESVSLQTQPFDEVLVYDDSSSDDTGRIARESGARVVRSDVNTGPSAGKNSLALNSTSDWVHFHDADDALSPHFVERARSWLMRDDVDVVLFGTQDRDDRTGRTLWERRWDDEALRQDAVKYCVVQTVTNCGVYRRQAFLQAGGFDTNERTKYNEDQAMHLRLALAGLRFRADEYVGAIIYRRDHSMSSGHAVECARAQYEVLAMVAAATGHRYATEIGGRLWRLAGVLGGYRDWAYARKCLVLARKVGYVDPDAEHPAMRVMARFSPFGAIVAREAFIRTFKRHLRRNYPVAG